MQIMPPRFIIFYVLPRTPTPHRARHPPLAAHAHPLPRTLPPLTMHALSRHYGATASTMIYHCIRTHLRNGPFRNTKRPVSQRDSARFRARNSPFCNALYINIIRQCTAGTRQAQKTRILNFTKKNLRIRSNIITFAVANLSQAVKSDL